MTAAPPHHPATPPGAPAPGPRAHAKTHIFDRPIGVAAVLVATLVLGALSLPRLKLELMPSDIQAPIVRVTMSMDTESSAETLEALTRPAEEIVRSLPGIRSVETTTNGGSLRMMVEPVPGVAPDVIAARVSEAFDVNRGRLTDLKSRPQVFTFSSGDLPMLWVAFSAGRLDDAAFADALERVLVPAALRVPGVTNVSHTLEGRGTVLVAFDQSRSMAGRVNAAKVAQYFAAARPRGFAVPTVDGGVRHDQVIQVSPGDLTPPGIPRLRIAGASDLSQVAAVVTQLPSDERRVLIDGKPGALMQIYRSPEANGYRTSKEVAAALQAACAGIGVSMLVQNSTHQQIDAATGELANCALWGGFFAALFLVLFLRRLRLAFIICLTLPLSLVMAILVLTVSGAGVNLMTMIGFLLAVGMVVDNGIVVGEALMRCPDITDPAERARRQRRAVGSVAMAVTVSTLTTLAIFVPMVVLTGNVWTKAFVSAMGRPIAWSLLASLIIALVVVPICFARLYRHGVGSRRRARWLDHAERWHGRLLAFVLLRPLAGMLMVGALVVPGMFMIALMFSGKLPAKSADSDTDNRYVSMPVEIRGNQHMDDIAKQFARWEDELRPHRQRLGVVSTVADFSLDWGTYYVYLLPIDPHGRPISEIEEEIPDLLSPGLQVTLDTHISRMQSEAVTIPDALKKPPEHGKDGAPVKEAVKAEVAKADSAKTDAAKGDGAKPDAKKAKPKAERGGGPGRFGGSWGPGNSRLSVRITAPDFQQLDDTWNALRDELKRTPGVRDPGPPTGDRPTELELALSVDAEAQGYRADSLAGQVTRFAGTREVAQMSDGWSLRMGPLEHQLRTMERLLTLDVSRADGSSNPLAALVTQGEIPTSQEIRRRDGLCQREYNVSVEQNAKSRLLDELPAIVERAGLPPGCNAGLGRWEARNLEDSTQMRLAIMLAVVIAYLLMGILYESVLAPLAVITMVPLTLVSVILWLRLANLPMDGMVTLGLLFLVGIVINHGVVMIDRLTRVAPLHRCDGSRRAALAIAGASRHRLSPVLLTSLTAIASALPMALGSGRLNGVAISSLGGCISIGLAGATLCTLLVMPIIYLWLGRFRNGLCLMVYGRPA